MQTKPEIFAIDYGTSNSLIAAASGNELSPPLKIDPLAGDPSVLRSVLFYPDNQSVHFGQKAIDEYAENGCEGRLFRSIKKYLPNPAFTATHIRNRPYRLEDIIATFLREMKSRAENVLEAEVNSAVIGRPARFSMNEENDRLAQRRLETAAKKAGFTEVDFFPEPLAAAYEYRQQMREEKILLVVDLGGGTSDFTVMRISPERTSQDDVLALGGISVAGDAMDGALMTSEVAPFFGTGVSYRPALSNNILEMPAHIKARLASAPDIALMTRADIISFIKEVEKTTLGENDRRKIRRLVTLVEDNLGFRLFELIEKCKRDLGEGGTGHLNFSYPDIDLNMEISQSAYQAALLPPIDEILQELDETVKRAQLKFAQIDMVCATGGTAKIPRIRDELFRRIQREKVEDFRHFHSVIQGLNRRARSLLNK